MRVIVCGGRMYGEVPNDCAPEKLEAETARAEAERRKLVETLDQLGITEMAHGMATGADSWAEAWAELRGIPCKGYKAKWRIPGDPRPYRPEAGPERNQLMLDDFKPDAVIAFPGGRGTADMVRRAKAAGVRVVEVPAHA